jgi:hypothetical protein
VPGSEQLVAEIGADEPGAPCYQNFHLSASEVDQKPYQHLSKDIIRAHALSAHMLSCIRSRLAVEIAPGAA